MHFYAPIGALVNLVNLIKACSRIDVWIEVRWRRSNLITILSQLTSPEKCGEPRERGEGVQGLPKKKGPVCVNYKFSERWEERKLKILFNF